jgi:phosphoglycerate dehydrogenase-like enzyme
VSGDLIYKRDEVEFIGRIDSGLDNIDASIANRNGILVINKPGGVTSFTKILVKPVCLFF